MALPAGWPPLLTFTTAVINPGAPAVNANPNPLVTIRLITAPPDPADHPCIPQGGRGCFAAVFIPAVDGNGDPTIIGEYTGVLQNVDPQNNSLYIGVIYGNDNPINYIDAATAGIW